jgi:hypothetical protein
MVTYMKDVAKVNSANKPLLARYIIYEVQYDECWLLDL